MGGDSSRWFDTFDLFGSRKAKAVAEESAAALNTAAAEPIAVAPAVEEVKKAQDDTKKKRTNLFATEGGVVGQELMPNQVSKRQTLLGN